MKFISNCKGEVMQDAGLGRDLRRWVCGLMLLVPSLLMPSYSAAVTVVSQQDVGNVTVMEVSGDFNMLTPQYTYNSQARADAAQAFFTTHRDEYDFLVFFTNFDIQMLPGVGGFYLPVHRNVQGIGKPVEDYNAAYGSDGRLMATIDMGDVHDKVLDPVDPGFEGTLLVLTHELMHHWGAYVKFKTPDGSVSSSLLGLDGGHWSYLLDSNSSTQYGNHWRDNGDGTFTSIPPETSQKGSSRGQLFSPLELYLMGMIDKNQVPPMLLIKNPMVDAAQLPKLNDTITGEATWVTIDDIIAAEGERIPTTADAQKNFRTAFIYLTQPGGTDLAQVADIESLRSEWIKRFSILTNAQGLMEVRSDLPVNDGLASNPGVTDPTFTPNPTPTINSGVNWLVSHQQANGSWQDVMGTAPRDTAASVAALANFATANASYQSGLAWLGSAPPAGTDYLARQVDSLQNKSAAVTTLLAGQNFDGGWGGVAGYLSNPTDSSLALYALASAGQSGAAVQAAVLYLLETQNADGGWGVTSGTSMIQPTAHALQALNAFRGSFTVASEIGQAITWLSSKQNGDGGFGNSPSTVYDTAVALVALRQAGASPSVIDSGAAYLLARQDANGSWNGSAFQTALATDALWRAQVQADLSIGNADISFNPPTVTQFPTTVSINAAIRNNGTAALSQVKAALYLGDPALGNLVAEQLVNFPGSVVTTVSFATMIDDSAQRTYFVVVDPQNLAIEGSELNNSALKALLVNVPAPTVAFVQPNSTSSEGAGTVSIQVSLSHQWDQTVVVNYVQNGGTATGGVDCSPVSGTITFASGETTKTLAVTLVDDLAVEGSETLIVELVGASGAVLGVTTRHTLTIADNDEAVPVVGFGVFSSSGGEIAGSVALHVTLNKSWGETVTVNYAVDAASTATRPNDFQLTDGVLTFAPGETTKDIVLLVADDNLEENAETVNVNLSNSVNATLGQSQHIYTILANDITPTVKILAPVGAINKSNPILIFEASEGTVVVKIDGQIVNKTSGDALNLSYPAEGQHTIRIEVTSAGGVLGFAEGSFTVDTIPPLVAILAPFIGVTNDKTPLLLFTTQDGWSSERYYNNEIQPGPLVDGTIAVTVDGVGVSQVSGESLDVLAAGVHTLRVDVADAAGNQASHSASFTVSPASSFSTNPINFITDKGYPAQRVVTDASGNIIVAGSAGTSFDLIVSKFDRNGHRQWVTQLVSTMTNVTSIGVDAAGDVYVAGTSSAGIVGNQVAGGFLLKIDRYGTYQWTKGLINGYGMSLSKTNIFAFGSYLDTKTNTTTSFIRKFDLNGVLIVEKLIPTTQIRTLSIDKNDNIFIAGVGTVKLSTGTGTKFVAKYSPLMAMTWAKQFEYGNESISGSGLYIDSNGVIYLRAFGSVIKMDANGNILWSVIAYGDDRGGACDGIAVDAQGYIYVGSLAFTGDMLVRFDNNGNMMQGWEMQLPSKIYTKGLRNLTIDTAGDIHIVGSVGLNSWGFHAKLNNSSLPDGFSQMFGINQVATPVNIASQVITGTREAGSIVAISVDTSAQVGPVTYPTANTWACTIENLVGGDNLITAISSGSTGTISAIASIELDMLPPLVSIEDDIATYFASQTIAGAREVGAIVVVSVDTIAVVESVSYPTTTSWRAQINGLIEGNNVVSVSARDQVGNLGFMEGMINRIHVEPIVMTIDPSSIAVDYRGKIDIVVSNLPELSMGVMVEQLLDSNHNGVADSGEPVIRSFNVSDGFVSDNPNVPGDYDGNDDFSIRTQFGFWNQYDLHHAQGEYVFRATVVTGSVEQSFSIIPVTTGQSVSGTVRVGTSAVAGGWVQLVDKWGRTVVSAVSDAQGFYLINAPRDGSYQVVASALGLVTRKSTIPVVEIGVGQYLTGVDLVLETADRQVVGRISGVSSGEGVSAVMIKAEDASITSTSVTDANGNYVLSVPAGEYQVAIDADTLVPSLQGYLVDSGIKIPAVVNSVGSAPQANFQLAKYTHVVCGKVSDESARPVAGVVMVGRITYTIDADQPTAMTITTADGDYCLGLNSQEGWTIGTNDTSASLHGYVGAEITDYSIASDPLDGIDLIVHTTNASLSGTVLDEIGGPVVGTIAIKTSNGLFKSSGKIANDGTYYLDLMGGVIDVKISPASGYSGTTETSVVVDDFEHAIRTFELHRIIPYIEYKHLDLQWDYYSYGDNYPICGYSSGSSISWVADDGRTGSFNLNGPIDIFSNLSVDWCYYVSKYSLSKDYTVFTFTAKNEYGYSSTSISKGVDYRKWFMRPNVIKAEYSESKQSLLVQATSPWGAQYPLQVIGYGTMTWDDRNGYWEFNKAGVPKPQPDLYVYGYSIRVATPYSDKLKFVLIK